MKDYLTVSEQAALLGEDPEDACGCEHPFEDHVACALNPSGPCTKCAAVVFPAFAV